MDFPDFPERQLSGKHHALDSRFGKRGSAQRGVDVHLGGGVQPQAGRAFSQKPDQARVLYDQCVHRQGAGVGNKIERFLQLVLQKQGVDRKVDLYPAGMAVLHGGF